MVTPLSAKTEDKKLILMQTSKLIEHAKGTGSDWASKTNFMVNRFIGAVPHASNEADSQLQKFDLLSSNLFELGRPQGLTSEPTETDISAGRRTRVCFLRMELRIFPPQCVPSHMKIPGLPEVKSLEVLIRLPKNENEDGLHSQLTDANMNDPRRLIMLLEALDRSCSHQSVASVNPPHFHFLANGSTLPVT